MLAAVRGRTIMISINQEVNKLRIWNGNDHSNSTSNDDFGVVVCHVNQMMEMIMDP